MPRAVVQSPPSLTRFGELLKYLRRRARLTQRELAIEVGYSEVHLSRLEGSYRPPDEQTLLALFVPALDLHDAPELVTRLLELAAVGRELPALNGPGHRHHGTPAVALGALEAIPLPPTGDVPRSDMIRLHQLLNHERVVAVCAMPGMGKTTLVAALARAAAAARPVFWLTLTTGITTMVSAVVRQLALFLLAHGQTQVLSILARGDNINNPLTLDEQIVLLGAALTRLVSAPSATPATQDSEPPLLCFDNLHLVQDDTAMMQVLGHLAAATPAALLLVSREQVPLPGITTFNLDRLERAEGRRLIAALNARLTPALAERLLDKTGGNPLLLRLALGLLEQQTGHSDIIAHLEQAPQIADILDATVRQLSLPAAHLLTLVAVFRQPLNLYNPDLGGLLQPADGIPDLALARRELQRRRLLDHPMQAALHPLLREHVSARLATDQQHKQRLHEIAALWAVRVLDDPVEAAYHYAVAGNIDGAGELLTAACHRLSEQGRGFAAVEVIDLLLAQVRQHGNTPGVTRQLLALRADLLVGTRRSAEAEANYRMALQLTLAPALRAPLAARLAESLMQRGQAEEAVAICLSARAPLDALHPLQLAQLFAAEGRAQIMCADYEGAQACAEQALAQIAPLGPAAPQATAEVRAQAYRITATVLRYQQQFEAAAIQLRHMLAAARQSNFQQLVHRCQSDRVMVYFALGDLESAISVCCDTVPLLQAAHDNYAKARLLSITSLCYLMHGDLAIALALVEQASEIARDIGDTHGLADTQLRHARILIAYGRIQEAHQLIERLLVTTAATGDTGIHGYVLDRLAMIQLLRGDPATAIATFERALALPARTADGKLHADVHNHRALALLVIGDDTAAAKALANRSTLRVPPSTVLTHHLIHTMLMLARGDDLQAVATAARAIVVEADATTHYLFSRAAQRLSAAISAPPPRSEFPRLHWVEAQSVL